MTNLTPGFTPIDPSKKKDIPEIIETPKPQTPATDDKVAKLLPSKQPEVCYYKPWTWLQWGNDTTETPKLDSTVPKIEKLVTGESTQVEQKIEEQTIDQGVQKLKTQEDAIAFNINLAKERMVKATDDPQFIELYDFFNKLVTDNIVKSVNETLEQSSTFSLTNIVGTIIGTENIETMIRVNIANGFANLAENIKKEIQNNPDLKGQPSFAVLMSLICKKINAKMGDINLNKLKPEEQKKVFNEIADDIMTLLFPNRIEDFKTPGWARFGKLVSPYVGAYSMIQSKIANLLLANYQQIAENPEKNEKWTKEIQNKIGKYDIDPITKAPTVLLTEYVKNIIKTDGALIDLVKSNLDSLTLSPNASEIEKMSNAPLAGWIVQSLQSMMNTKDPSFVNAGNFIATILKNLTLGLMAEGTSHLISKYEKIDKDQFLKVLFDRVSEMLKLYQKEVNIPLVQALLNAGVDKLVPSSDPETEKARQIEEEKLIRSFVVKLKAEGQEKITEKEIRSYFDEVRSIYKGVDEFCKDFPIPPLFRSQVIAFITQQMMTSQIKLKADWNEMQKQQESAVTTLKGYKGGTEIIALIEKMTDKVVNEALTNSGGVIEKFVSGDKLDTLLDQQLPGITISPELKNWFKGNVTALATGSEPIEQVKKAVHAVLCKAILTTYETNNKEGSVFVNGFLRNLTKPLESVVTKMTPHERKELSQAVAIQKDIDERLKRIENFDKGITDEKKVLIEWGTTLEEQNTIKDFITVFDKQYSITANIKNSSLKLEKNLKEINKDLDAPDWNEEKLVLIEKALHSKAQNKSTEAELSILEALSKLPNEKLKIVEESLRLRQAIAKFKNEDSYLTKEMNNLGGEIDPDVVSTIEKLGVQMRTRDRLAASVEKQEAELDAKILPFKTLTDSLSGVFGLDKKEALLLHPTLRDEIWKYVTVAKEKQIPRLAFKYVYPFLLPIIEKEKTRDQLIRLSKGNMFFVEMCKGLAKDVVDMIPTKIKNYKPEELAKLINEMIPGDQDFTNMIAPEIQSIFSSDAQQYNEVRGFVESIIESFTLKIFTKFAENIEKQNPGKTILEIFSDKLKSLSASDKYDKMTKEEAVNKMIEEIMVDLMGIKSGKDIPGVPADFQDYTYSKLQEALKAQLSPICESFIDRDKDRDRLKALSGNEELGNICKALSQDILSFIPGILNSYKTVSEKIFKTFTGLQPSPQDIAKIESKLIEKMKDSKKPLTNSDLVEVYKSAMNLAFQPQATEVLHKLAKEAKLKEDARKIVITPEEVIAQVEKFLPNTFKLNGGVDIAKELQDWFHSDSESYKNVSAFLETYIEGALLKVFIRIAEKNPRTTDKDVLANMTENMLNRVASKYEALKGRPVKDVAKELNDEIMKEILGIDSEKVFAGLPLFAQKKAYEAIQGQIGIYVETFCEHFKKLGSEEKEVLDAKRGLEHVFGGTCVEMLSYDITNMVIGSLADFYTQIEDKELKGVTVISDAIKQQLIDMNRADMKIAKVLLNYSGTEAFKKILAGKLQAIQKSEFQGDKAQAAKFTGNLLLRFFNNALSKLEQVEDDHGRAINNEIGVNILELAAEHMKVYNDAKLLAAADGRKEVMHKDLVKASGGNLHKAFVQEGPDYKATIADINKKLNFNLDPNEQEIFDKKMYEVIHRLVVADKKGDGKLTLEKLADEIDKIVPDSKQILVMKVVTKEKLETPNAEGFYLMEILSKDIDKPHQQQSENFYDDKVKSVMKLVCPNGKDDLTFIPEGQRNAFWKLLQTQLFPTILQIVIESVLNRETLTGIVLSSLETVRDSFRSEIKYGKTIDYIKMRLQEQQRIEGSTKLPRTFSKEEEKRLNATIERLVNEKGVALTNAVLIHEIGKVINLSENETQALEKVYARGMTLSDIAEKEAKDALVETEVNEEMDAMDLAAGKLMLQVLNMTQLPPMIQKKLFDQNGNVNPSVVKAIGATMRKQFNENFLSTTLRTLFEKMGARDEKTGKPILNFEKPEGEGFAELDKMDIAKAKLKAVSREVVDEAIISAIKGFWDQLQERWNAHIESVFGTFGVKAKEHLDQIFAFVFFKLVGAVLEFLTRPIRPWIKERLYDYIKLDENRDAILEMLINAPEDQPFSFNHFAYNENLFFNIIDSFSNSLKTQRA